MIVVLRYFLNRLPHQIKPRKNTPPATASPTVTCHGSKPPASIWQAYQWSGVRQSLNLGFGVRTSAYRLWLAYNPRAALSAIQVGASSQTCDWRTSLR